MVTGKLWLNSISSIFVLHCQNGVGEGDDIRSFTEYVVCRMMAPFFFPLPKNGDDDRCRLAVRWSSLFFQSCQPRITVSRRIAGSGQDVVDSPGITARFEWSIDGNSERCDFGVLRCLAGQSPVFEKAVNTWGIHTVVVGGFC